MVVVWILSFALITLIDNQDGFYPINKVGLFVFVSLAMLVFVYGVQKVSAELSLRNLKIYLADLEANDLEQTKNTERIKKKLRWVYLIVIILGTASFIIGVLKMLNLI